MLLDIFDRGELTAQFLRQYAAYLIFADSLRLTHILQGVFSNQIIFNFIH